MKSRFITFFLVLSLTSCSLLTKSGRQQRAYEKYVRKSSLTRYRQQKKFNSGMPKMPFQQDKTPEMTATAPESPQSVTASASESPPQ